LLALTDLSWLLALINLSRLLPLPLWKLSRPGLSLVLLLYSHSLTLSRLVRVMTRTVGLLLRRCLKARGRSGWRDLLVLYPHILTLSELVRIMNRAVGLLLRGCLGARGWPRWRDLLRCEVIALS
jgi:hypothetical protein